MRRHVLFVCAGTLLIIVCMVGPFLPGGYDSLALTLSVMAQMIAVVGLLLVPIGVAWLVHDGRRRRGAAAGIGPVKDRGYGFALTSIGVATMVALLMSVAAFADVGPSLGFAVLALWAYAVARFHAAARAARQAPARPFSAAPLYLVVLPIAAAVVRFALFGALADFSRNRAIDNSAPLIADIERYHDANGRYPPSMAALWADYKPGVIGVPHYRYEPSGDVYNVFFEHPSDIFGTHEIVMYNKRDEHLFFSHDSDRVAVPPRPLRGGGGFYAVTDAGRPRWKRFLFD